MDKEKIINRVSDAFIKEFRRGIREHAERYERVVDASRMTDDDIRKIIAEYFEKKTLSEAEHYLNEVIYDYFGGRWEDIDRQREDYKETPEFKAWAHTNDICSAWYCSQKDLELSKDWVAVNGKAHTNEEAATIAANKWCELIFGWHLQDNGALNEDHPGGFMACALATSLGNDARERVTEEMKVKAHTLFKEYYLRDLHYSETYDRKDLEWLKNTLVDETGEYEWKYGFGDLSCDYDPTWPLYLILFHAGIKENDIRSLCPWKTTIRIRKEDNVVMYSTYQNREEL